MHALIGAAMTRRLSKRERPSGLDGSVAMIPPVDKQHTIRLPEITPSSKPAKWSLPP